MIARNRLVNLVLEAKSVLLLKRLTSAPVEVIKVRQGKKGEEDAREGQKGIEMRNVYNSGFFAQQVSNEDLAGHEEDNEDQCNQTNAIGCHGSEDEEKEGDHACWHN